MDTKSIVSLLIGLSVSVAGLYLAFRNVPFTELIGYLGIINYWYVFPAVLLVIVSFMLRAVRWQVILSATRNISFTQSFHPMMIGFMSNCVLPGRIGEVARPAILRQQEGVPFTTGIATVAAERVFDLIFLIGLLALVMARVDVNPELTIRFQDYQLNKDNLEAIGSGMIKACGVLLIGMIGISLQTTRNFILKAIERIPALFFLAGKRFQDGIRKYFSQILIKIVTQIAEGFELIKNPQKTLFCFVLSASIWTLQALSYYAVAVGSPGISLSFSEIYAMMIFICFFIALPSVPGFWGLWEAGGIFALTLFGVTGEAAAGYTLANHAVQVFPVIIVGFISAFVLGINIRHISLKR